MPEVTFQGICVAFCAYKEISHGHTHTCGLLSIRRTVKYLEIYNEHGSYELQTNCLQYLNLMSVSVYQYLQMSFTTWFARCLRQFMPENEEKSHVNFLCETKKVKRGNWQKTSLLVSHCGIHKQDTLPWSHVNTYKIYGQLWSYEDSYRI